MLNDGGCHRILPEDDRRGWAVLEAAGFKTYFTFLNDNNYGLKWRDCLDLQKLMTDSDFLQDVCMACNAEGESPHVFPADSTVCDLYTVRHQP